MQRRLDVTTRPDGAADAKDADADDDGDGLADRKNLNDGLAGGPDGDDKDDVPDGKERR